MTDQKPPEMDKKEKKERALKPNRLSFYDDQKNGRLYLTVINNSDQYYFAYQTDGGEIEFVEELSINGKKTLPQKIPEANGRPTEVIKVPKMELLNEVPVPDADSLAEDIKNHICRYFDAPALEIEMFTYYIFFTWFYLKTSVAPLLRFLADLGSGKSRGVDVIGDLCFYRTKLDGGTTLSSIMRTKQAWNGTVTMDEADLKQGYREESGGYDDTLIKFLNLGFQRGKYILKTNTEDHDVQEVFDPFCPKILGMRAVFRDSATESRCLSYSPRETRRIDIPNILPPKYAQETDLLVAKLARFTLHHWKTVDGGSYANFNNIQIDQRTRQLSLPLSVVIKQLFPAGEERFKKYILRRFREIRRQRAQSEEGVAFNTLYAIALGEINLKDDFSKYYNGEEDIPGRVTTGMLARAYGYKNSNKVTALLTRTLHFEKKKERVKEKPEWIIVIPDFETWRSAFSRYYFNENEKESLDLCPSIPAALSRTGEEVTDPGTLEHLEQTKNCEKTLEHLEQKEAQIEGFDKKCSNVPNVPKPSTCVIENFSSSSTTHPPIFGTNGTLEQNGNLMVRMLIDLDPFMGIDGNLYECKNEDVITLPRQHAESLIERGAAVLISTRGA